MVVWTDATKKLSQHLKQIALQECITQAKGLGGFSGLYAGKDRGGGVYNALCVARVPENLSTVLGKYC